MASVRQTWNSSRSRPSIQRQQQQQQQQQQHTHLQHRLPDRDLRNILRGGGGGAHSPEPSRPRQSRAEQSRAEESRAEQGGSQPELIPDGTMSFWADSLAEGVEAFLARGHNERHTVKVSLPLSLSPSLSIPLSLSIPSLSLYPPHPPPGVVLSKHTLSH